MKSNTNSTGTSNLSNLNLTPKSKNQITSPLSYNSKSTLSNFYPNKKWLSSTKKLPIEEEEKNKNKTFSNGWQTKTMKAETPKNQMDNLVSSFNLSAL